jgi:hypothetical protein
MFYFQMKIIELIYYCIIHSKELKVFIKQNHLKKKIIKQKSVIMNYFYFHEQDILFTHFFNTSLKKFI